MRWEAPCRCRRLQGESLRFLHCTSRPTLSHMASLDTKWTVVEALFQQGLRIPPPLPSLSSGPLRGMPLLYVNLIQPQHLTCRMPELPHPWNVASDINAFITVLMAPSHQPCAYNPGVCIFAVFKGLHLVLCPHVVTEETNCRRHHLRLRSCQETPARLTLPATLRSGDCCFPLLWMREMRMRN